MFKNFSFQVSTSPADIARRNSSCLSPLALNDDEISPYFRWDRYDIDDVHPSEPSTYFTPPPTPPELDMQYRLRQASITSVLEGMTLQDNTKRVSISRNLTPEVPRDSVRLQRQMLSRLHVEDNQRKCLSDLVEDMIAKGSSCSVKVATSSPMYSSPPTSDYECDVSGDDEDHLDVSDRKSTGTRKSWTHAAVSTSTSPTNSLRGGGVQKKVKKRKSLNSLTVDRSLSRRRR